MKKVLFLAVVAAGMAVGLSSCSSSCVTCTYAGLASTTFCKKDYTATQYDAVVAAATLAGYTCK